MNNEVQQKAWIGVVSRAHVMRGVEGGFAQLCHGKRSALARMNTGDWLIYYSPTTEFKGGETLRAFTAIGEVQEKLVAFDMGGGFVPYRRDVRFERPAREVPIATLMKKLEFIANSPNWGMVMRRGHFAISTADFQTIRNAMLPARE